MDLPGLGNQPALDIYLFCGRIEGINENMTDALESRKTLPEHLRVLAEKYPRDGWEAHSNFDEMTRFWLDRHLMFREVIGKIQSQTRGYLDGPTPRFAPELARYTGFFLNQLHGHHTIEDHHYFPVFNKLDNRLERAFDILDRDHHALDGHIHGLAEKTNAVLEQLQAGRDARSEADLLLTAQHGFERFLNRHLFDEEEIIVPLVLEYAPDMHGL